MAVFRSGIFFFKNCRAICLNLQRAGSLYCPATLGISRYENTRNNTIGRFTDNINQYREKMKMLIGENEKSMIFTEDLRNMVYIATNEDVDLVKSMIKKYNLQNKELRFGTFVFGPEIMRMFHYLNLPDAAIEVFEDNVNFFSQLSSYQTLLDLLYKNKRYDDLIRMYDIIKTNQTDLQYRKSLVILVTAACYKQNTKESWEYACKLWTGMMDTGHFLIRRAVTSIAALAINQNQPHMAIEVISNVKEQRYITVRNLKISALCDLHRIDDALTIIRNSINMDIPVQNNRPAYAKDIWDKIEKAVEQKSSKETTREFEFLKKAAIDRELIGQYNIDELLTQQITITYEQDGSESNQNRSRRRSVSNASSRPGLLDYY